MYFHKARKISTGFYFELCDEEPCTHPVGFQHKSYEWAASPKPAADGSVYNMPLAAIVREIAAIERAEALKQKDAEKLKAVNPDPAILTLEGMLLP